MNHNKNILSNLVIVLIFILVLDCQSDSLLVCDNVTSVTSNASGVFGLRKGQESIELFHSCGANYTVVKAVAKISSRNYLTVDENNVYVLEKNNITVYDNELKKVTTQILKESLESITVTSTNNRRCFCIQFVIH